MIDRAGPFSGLTSRAGAVALLALALAASAFLHGKARADFFWDQDCDPSAATPCTADNFEHTYCWADNYDASNLRDAASYAMQNLGQQTLFWRNFVTSCGPNIDIVWTRFSDPTLRGRYDCVDASGPNCGKARVYMNPDNLVDQHNKEKTACHEVGHSGGLSHADDAGDCMITGFVSQGHRTYTDHHVAHLNDN